MIESVGTSVAVTGSIISVIGSCINNLQHNHRMAMEFWMVSNVLLLVWCIGNLAGLWNGGISVFAMLCMYLIFATTNYWGLYHVR